MRLEPLNPWWHDDRWHMRDPHLSRLEAAEYRWRPGWLDRLSLVPPSLNFVLGPRQVGKTTGLKMLIRELVEGGADPRSVAYVDCDLIVDLRELRSTLTRLPARVDKVILDEVTGLEYWWRVVRGLIDGGFLARRAVVVSGSSSVRVRRYSESFVGRRGMGRDVEVLPLSFREFADVRGYGPSGLEAAFEEYLSVGGFPRSVNGDPSFEEEVPDQIDREVARAGRSARIARQVIYQVVEKAPSALSYNSIAREIGVSHVTVREYLELLEDLFVVGVAYWRSGGRISFRKEKKVFFRDPMIPSALLGPRGEVGEDALCEWVVQEHLLRRYGEVYYYRDGYEVDAVAGDLRVEVKCGRARRRYPRGVTVLSREDLPYFLYEIGV